MQIRTVSIAGIALTIATAAGAQNAPAIAPADQQIAGAVLSAPQDLRASASVLGYDARGNMVTLRKGTGALVCLATDPKSKQFHTACYHKSLEPFMARGRALRAQGVKGDQVDTVRFREIKERKLVMPTGPAVLYQIFGSADSVDLARHVVKGGTPLYVVYMPFATGESVGLSAKPVEGAPWVMHPGTPKAHIMFTPRMAP
jgi:hypothetical protein